MKVVTLKKFDFGRQAMPGRFGTTLVAASLLAVLAVPVQAVVISKIYVGTLSNPLTGFGANPANNPGEVARGNKYVIKTTFDTADMTLIDATTRNSDPSNQHLRDFQSIALSDAPGGSNTFELFIPSEGFGGILTQTGQDHFAIGAGFAPTAEIHFFNSCNSAGSCAAEFRGFEFESNFIVANDPNVPDAGGDIIFELRDPDVNFSGTTVTNNVVNVLDGDPAFVLQSIMSNGGTTDVLSESNSSSGGQLNPGVFLGEAVAVVAEAGASPLAYSAGTLSVTTVGGTEQVTEVPAAINPGDLRSAPSAFDDQPRQADNDLGADRSDGEDFLSYQWTADGANVAGNESGTRLDRGVETLTPGGKSFVTDATDRTVDDVNITRSLAQSGLQNTTDTTTFDVLVTESITGFSDTDSVAVSYQNAGPMAEAGGDIVFNAANAAAGAMTSGASADDLDMAANAQVAGFETLTAEASVGGSPIGANDVFSGSTTSNAINRIVALLDSGLTMTTDTSALGLTVTDFAGASASDSATIRYENALPVIANASATALGADLQFNLMNTDLDLAVNAIIGGFEALLVDILIDGLDQSAFFAPLIGDGTGGSQFVSNADLMGALGLGAGLHTFKVNLSDKALLLANAMPVMFSFDFEVLNQGGVAPAPVPATLLLFLLGLTALGGVQRRDAAKQVPAQR